jgi:hypothetical protein
MTPSPTVADNKVYATSDDGKVYCMNTVTGSLIWNSTIGDYPERSSPTIVDERVYIGSANHNIYCLNASSGSVLWKYATGDSIEWSSPAISDGKLYIGSFDKHVYCLGSVIGSRIWSYITEGEVLSSPAISNGRVYIGSNDGNVYAFGASTLTHLIEIDGNTYSVETVSNSIVSPFSFNEPAKRIGFNVTGSAGFCNVTFQTTTLGGPYAIQVDESPVAPTQTSNSTHTLLYFTYPSGTHRVTITATNIVPEFPNMITMMPTLTALALAILLRKRRLNSARSSEIKALAN